MVWKSEEFYAGEAKLSRTASPKPRKCRWELCITIYCGGPVLDRFFFKALMLWSLTRTRKQQKVVKDQDIFWAWAYVIKLMAVTLRISIDIAFNKLKITIRYMNSFGNFCLTARLFSLHNFPVEYNCIQATSCENMHVIFKFIVENARHTCHIDELPPINQSSLRLCLHSSIQ